MEESKQVDISMDSRKSNGEEWVLKRDYGVIRLGIGEEKIDSEESFGSNSDSDDYQAKEEKKGQQKTATAAKNAEGASPSVESKEY